MSRIVGIDVGASEIKIAEYNGKAIINLVSVQSPENLIREGDIVAYDTAAILIKGALKSNKIKAKYASVILPENEVSMKQITVPSMDRKKIVANIPYELHDYLVKDKSDYIFDYTVNNIVKDEKGKPVQLEITAAAILKDTVRSYKDMLKKAGLTMKYAIPVESAYANIIKLDKECESKEYAFGDLGHDGARIIFYVGSKNETTRIIEKGGLKNVDYAIAEKEHVSDSVAHSYKETNTNNVLLSEEVVSVFRSAATDVRRAINFYALNKADTNLTDLYLCGGGTAIELINKGLSDMLDVNVHLAEELFPKINCDVPYLSKYTNAIGAAINNKGMNLISREREQFSPVIVMPSLIMILAVAALFAKFGVIDRFAELDRYRAEAAALADYNIQLKMATKDYDSVQAEYNKYSTRFMTENETILLDRADMLKLLEKEFFPAGKVLSYSSNSNILTVQLSGVTLEDTSKLIDILQARPDVVSVTLSTAKAEDKTPTGFLDETEENVDAADTSENASDAVDNTSAINNSDENSEDETEAETTSGAYDSVVTITVVMTEAGGEEQ